MTNGDDFGDGRGKRGPVGHAPDEIGRGEIAIDVVDLDAVLPFWEAVLDYERRAGADLADPEGNEVDLAPWRDDSPWKPE